MHSLGYDPLWMDSCSRSVAILGPTIRSMSYCSSLSHTEAAILSESGLVRISRDFSKDSETSLWEIQKPLAQYKHPYT